MNVEESTWPDDNRHTSGEWCGRSKSICEISSLVFDWIIVGKNLIGSIKVDYV